MSLRIFLMLFSIPMLITGGLASSFGPATIPYDMRGIFPISWGVENPVAAFFGSVVVLIIALLMRPNRVTLVNDFAN